MVWYMKIQDIYILLLLQETVVGFTFSELEKDLISPREI